MWKGVPHQTESACVRRGDTVFASTAPTRISPLRKQHGNSLNRKPKAAQRACSAAVLGTVKPEGSLEATK